jgi:predicted nucleotidyltransferase
VKYSIVSKILIYSTDRFQEHPLPAPTPAHTNRRRHSHQNTAGALAAGFQGRPPIMHGAGDFNNYNSIQTLKTPAPVMLPLKMLHISEEHILSKTNYKVSMIPFEKELSEYFNNKDSVILAYLFGSTVRGDAGRLSDVDIGVMLDEKLSKKDRFDLELKLMGEIAILIKKNEIDLIVLSEAPLLLAYNIIKTGIILKSDETERVKFETKIFSMYMDEKYYIKRHTEETLKRIAKVGFS